VSNPNKSPPSAPTMLAFSREEFSFMQFPYGKFAARRPFAR
jgi:hypothetical protein